MVEDRPRQQAYKIFSSCIIFCSYKRF